MGRRIVGLVVGAVVIAAIATFAGSPAGAGGANQLRPDREFYQPGDPVHLSGEVYKTDLDWFGPYTVYLRPVDPTATGSDPRVRAGEHPGDIAVGRLVVTRINPQIVTAEITFVLPNLTDGMWQVDYCAPDCSKRLGDLYDGGWLHVGTAAWVPPTTVAVPSPAPTPTVASVSPTPTTARVAPSTTAGADLAAAEPVVAVEAPSGTRSDEATRWWLAGLAGAVALVAALVLLRRGGRLRTVTRSTTPLATGNGDGVVTVEHEPQPPGDDVIGAAR